MYFFWTVLFGVSLFLSWGLTVFGLPGNWIMVILSAGFAWAFPEHFGWTMVAVIAGLALVAEVIEFLASGAGLAKGGSKRGAALAIVGSLVGSALGAAVGLPIPWIGSVVGVLIFSSLGAMGGAILGEVWKGKDTASSIQIGQAAFWGRLFGTLAKVLFGSIMIAVAIAGAVL
jgi:uncharacterized protein